MSRHTRFAWVAALALAPLGLVASAVVQGAFAAPADDPGAVLLMPGSEESFDLAVHNDSTDPATLQVQVVDVAEDDHGCVRPEEQAGDTTCGAGGGELGAWLDLRLVEVDASGEQALWSGTLDQLAAGTDVLEQVAGASTTQLRLHVALPRAATNDTMSDAVTFRLRSTLTGQPGPSTVLGVQQGTSGGTGGGTGVLGPLAATGTAVSLVVIAALLVLLATGSMLVTYGRRTGPTPPGARPDGPPWHLG